MTGWKVAAVDRVARAIVWVARLVKGWLPRTLGGASALALLLWGVLDDQLWGPIGWTLLIAGIVLALLAFFAELIVQRPSYMKLSQLREEAEIRANGKSEALERALKILLARLGEYCKLVGHSDRLSVYYFHDGEFVMVARQAKNPTFEARTNRPYPADQGAIGTAWQSAHGQALVNMPAAKDSWRRAAKNQGLSDSAIDGMKMRSLALGGVRLETPERSVGVLMVESATSKRITQAHLDLIATSHIVAAIAELVASFAMLTPAGESAVAAKTEKPIANWKSVLPRAPLASSGS